MQAVILNSGMGSRLGSYTKNHPKCMVELSDGETILSRQLKLLKKAGIKDIIITTGYMQDTLIRYAEGLNLDLNYTWVYNADYTTTNYIVSLDKIGMATGDIILMHGDLIFSYSVLERLLETGESSVIIDSASELSEKDFKAKLKDGRVDKIGINYFGKDCVALQPMYYLKERDWLMWKQKIRLFCAQGRTNVYAEEAYNAEEELLISPVDLVEGFCGEIDNEKDLEQMCRKIKEVS